MFNDELFNKKKGRGRPKSINSMSLVEVLQAMQKDFDSWRYEADPWDYEALVLHDDMAAVKELKKLFKSTGLDEVPSTDALLKKIYNDRLEQLAERERFQSYVQRLYTLLIYHNLIMSPAGFERIRLEGEKLLENGW